MPLVVDLTYCLSMKKEAVYSSETLLNFYRCCVPEDGTPNK
jgi:hypothetical protein